MSRKRKSTKSLVKNQTNIPWTKTLSQKYGKFWLNCSKRNIFIKANQFFLNINFVGEFSLRLRVTHVIYQNFCYDDLLVFYDVPRFSLCAVNMVWSWEDQIRYCIETCTPNPIVYRNVHTYLRKYIQSVIKFLIHCSWIT